LDRQRPRPRRNAGRDGCRRYHHGRSADRSPGNSRIVKRLALLFVVLLVAGVSCAAVLADTAPPATTTTTATAPATTTVPTTTTVVTTTTTTTTPVQVVADGVMLAGLDIGGLTAPAAVAAVQQAFAQPLTLHFLHS